MHSNRKEAQASARTAASAVISNDAVVQLATRFVNIVTALRSYKRHPCNKPASSAVNPASTDPPLFWRDRLPVHAIAEDALGTLVPELSASTVNAIATIIEAAGHNPDSLYVGIAERVLDGSALKLPRRETISMLRTVLSAIRDHRRAAETAMRVAESMPCGAERHQVFCQAAKLADQWVADAVVRH